MDHQTKVNDVSKTKSINKSGLPSLSHNHIIDHLATFVIKTNMSPRPDRMSQSSKDLQKSTQSKLPQNPTHPIQAVWSWICLRSLEEQKQTKKSSKSNKNNISLAKPGDIKKKKKTSLAFNRWTASWCIASYSRKRSAWGSRDSRLQAMQKYHIPRHPKVPCFLVGFK